MCVGQKDTLAREVSAALLGLEPATAEPDASKQSKRGQNDAREAVEQEAKNQQET